MFAVQAWCAPMAREMANTATHRLLEPAAMITPTMQQANRNIDISRALT